MIILLAILSILLLWFLKYILDLHVFASKLKDFKCPPQTFLLGHLPEMTKDIFGTILQYNKKYGKLLHLNATYFAPVLLISDIDMAKEVITSPNALNKGRLYEAFHATAKDTLPLASDKIWQGLRKFLTPAFTVQNIKQSINVFNSVASILADKLGMYGDQEIELLPLIDLCTLDATFESLMGAKINCQLDEKNNFNVHTMQMDRIFRKKIFSPWTTIRFLYVFTPTYWKEQAAVKAIHKEANKIITDRRRQIQAGDEKEEYPFLDTMLKGSIPGRVLTDDDIVRELVAFIFAARDTTGSTIATALHILGHYPEIQNRVVEELKEVFKDDVTRPVTLEDLKELKYLEAFVKEVLRKYPSVAFVGRQLKKDETFNGVFIPANMNVIICIHAIHNSEEYYPNPHIFDPDRFYGDNATSIKPFSYLPFSAGSRNCLGQRHAMSELKIIMAHILRRHEVLPVGKKELDMTIHLALVSRTPIKITVKPRTGDN